MVLDGLLYRAPVGLVVLDARGAIASLNEQAHQIFQSDGAPINGTPLADLFPESQQKLLQRHLGGSRRQKKTASQPIVLERRTAGRKKQLLELRLAVIEGHDEAACWICSVENVTKREQTTSAHERTRRDLERRVTQRTKVLAALNKTLKQEIADHQRSDESLHESRQQLSLALGAAQVGTWVWEVGEDAVTWDDYIHPLFGLEPGTFPGRYADFLHLVHPEDRERVSHEVADSVRNNTKYDTEFRVVWPKDQSVHYLAARGKVFRDEYDEPQRIMGVCWDVTERKRVAQELANRAAELARSNADLMQFAYVASHDLQEPLRAVAGYCQLLRRRYRDQLDEEANRLIDNAVEGAKRMQDLVNGLLEYSRVQRHASSYVPVDCNGLIDILAEDMEEWIQASGATIQRGSLPEIVADAAQLGRLFQNLISNAIKYRSSQPLLIQIDAQEDDRQYVFSVRDNGIGIDPKYHDRIFVIFERLHARSEYPGTGIGLALCKRIVDRHAGRIWVESQLGEGCTFFFTIPKLG